MASYKVICEECGIINAEIKDIKGRPEPTEREKARIVAQVHEQSYEGHETSIERNE